MRQLRFLKPGDDVDHMVVETADGSEQFALFITPAMREAMRSDLPKLNPLTPTVEPPAGISPRDIQMRVRAGADPQHLADAHDMEIGRVMRFARAVLDERIRVADEARRARARRSTTEGQTVVFGEAVDQRFAAHGVDPYEVSWDAYRRGDGQWVITASWERDDVERRAEWAFHLHARNVTPIDDTAADLLSDRPVRPIAMPVADEPDGDAAPALAPGVVAFPRLAPPVADEPEPPADDLFDQEAPNADRAEAESADAYHAPALPLRLAEEPAAEITAEDPDVPTSTKTTPLPKVKNLGVAHREGELPHRRPNPRPKVPSWDDIMLGVRRTTD